MIALILALGAPVASSLGAMPLAPAAPGAPLLIHAAAIDRTTAPVRAEVFSPGVAPSTGPGEVRNLAMAYDAADGRVIAVTPQTDPNLTSPTMDTWELSSGNWTLVNTTGSPPARFHASMVYDSRRQALVLFGGTSFLDTGPNGSAVDTPLNDTWTYSHGTWTLLTGTAAPPSRNDAAFVDDAWDGCDLLLGGYPNQTTTWALYPAGWSPLLSGGPSPTAGGGIVYDAADGYVLYFGGLPVTGGSNNETWTFRGGVWTNVTGETVGAPGPRGGASLAYDAALGKVILFGGDLSNPRNPTWYGLLNDSYEYSNGTWSPLPLTGAPSPRASAAFVYDAADNVSVIFGGWYYKYNASCDCGGYTQLGDTWLLSIGSTSWSHVATLHLTPSHPSGEVGVDLSILASGVLAPAGSTYAFAGLPSGCDGQGSAQVSCVPTLAGHFTISASVVTSLGLTANASLPLAVMPPLEIAGFGAAESTLHPGSSTSITVIVAGGLGPFTYAYAGLPEGCPSASTSDLVCAFPSPGTFNISVVVTDSIGGSNSSRTVVQVVNATVVGPSPNLPSSGSFLGLGAAGSVAVGVAVGGAGAFAVAVGVFIRRRRLAREGDHLLEEVRRWDDREHPSPTPVEAGAESDRGVR